MGYRFGIHNDKWPSHFGPDIYDCQASLQIDVFAVDPFDREREAQSRHSEMQHTHQHSPIWVLINAH